jgi:hypothetical protein
MAKSKFAQRLAKMQGAFGKAKTAEFTNVPPGKYDAHVTVAKLAEYDDGTPYIQWEYQIEGGDYDEKKVQSRDGLKSKAVTV